METEINALLNHFEVIALVERYNKLAEDCDKLAAKHRQRAAELEDLIKPPSTMTMSGARA